MAESTNIAWTDATWNPIIGCSIVSPGCTNCYAMKMADRIQAMQAPALMAKGHINPYVGTTIRASGRPVWSGSVTFNSRALTTPIHWAKPRKVFVNSMSDLFHEAVPDEWIDQVFAVMALCPQHTFQVLTKRSARMKAYCADPRTPERIAGHILSDFSGHVSGSELLGPLGNRSHERDPEFVSWPLPNVWIGVSCEDQARANERIPDLLATPAAVRFVSAEPLIGPITSLPGLFYYGTESSGGVVPLRSRGCSQVDWIIAGGESGPGRRPMNIEWAESIMQQCRDSGTAFFFKQDSAFKSGQSGMASDELWACKAFPF